MFQKINIPFRALHFCGTKRCIQFLPNYELVSETRWSQEDELISFD